MKLRNLIKGALVALSFGVIAGSAGAGASDEVTINSTNFPDDIFRQYVTSYDINKDGVLSDSELSSVVTINVRGRDISNLKGIAHFKNLKTLNCNGNNLQNLSLESNTMLTYLDAGNNKLNEINVSGNVLLRSLICSNNNISDLDVTHNKTLNYLDASGNELSGLDTSKCTDLSVLNVSNNQITVIDLYNNLNLSTLTANDNHITFTDLTANKGLVTINLSGNNLVVLDVSNNTSLGSLDCSDNGLLFLNLSKEITSLDCSNNELSALNLEGLTKLSSLDAADNNLYALDVATNTSLTSINASGNRLASIDISECSNLKAGDVILNKNSREVYVAVNGEVETDRTTIDVDKIISISTAGVVTDQSLTAEVSKSALLVSDMEKLPSAISYSYNIGNDIENEFKVVTHTTKKIVPSTNIIEAYAPASGEVIEFPLYVTAIGGETDITFASANSSIASVSAEGLLQVNSPGTTTVSASAEGFDSALFNIKVYEQNTDIEVSEIPVQLYTGNAICPVPKVMDGDTALVENEDFIISYENNTNAGIAVAVIKGCGKYSFEIFKRFRICYNIATMTADEIPDQIYTGSAVTPDVSLTNGTYKLEKGKDYVLEYMNNIEIGTGIITITGIGNYSGSKIQAFNIIVPKVNNLVKTGNYKTQMKLSWDKIDGVTGYRIYRYNSTTKKYAYLKQITGSANNTYTDTGLTSGTYCKYRVRAYVTVNGVKKYGKYSTILKTYTKFKKVSSFKVTAGKKQATIKWKKMSGVTGYRVYMKKSGGKYSKIAELKGAGKVSFVKTGLTKNKNYTFKVRVFKTVNGKNVYGAYTTEKKVKIK